jgi:hypothetical protein
MSREKGVDVSDHSANPIRTIPVAMFGFFVNDQLGGYTESFHSCSCPLKLIKLRLVTCP